MKSIIAVASALVLASGAHATSSVVVNITNFNVSATGAYTLSNVSNGFGAYVYDQAAWSEATGASWANGVSNYTYGPGVQVSTAAGNSAAAFFTQTGYGFTLQTGAQGGIAESELNLIGELSLAPHATLTVEWDRSVVGTNAGQTVASNSIMFVNGMVVNTSGRAGDDWKGFDPVYAVQSLNNVAAFGMSADGHQTLTFTNDSDTTLNTVFQGSIQVYTQDAVVTTNVPEPEQYGMFLAGVAVVGASLLRRRRG